MSIKHYIENYFVDGDKPARNTVLSWIKRGDLYSERKGNRIYVDPERNPFNGKKTSKKN